MLHQRRIRPHIQNKRIDNFFGEIAFQMHVVLVKMVKMCKIDIPEDCADGSGEDSLPQNRDFPASSKSRHNSPLSFAATASTFAPLCPTCRYKGKDKTKKGSGFLTRKAPNKLNW